MVANTRLNEFDQTCWNQKNLIRYTAKFQTFLFDKIFKKSDMLWFIELVRWKTLNQISNHHKEEKMKKI